MVSASWMQTLIALVKEKNINDEVINRLINNAKQLLLVVLHKLFKMNSISQPNPAKTHFNNSAIMIILHL